MPSSALTPQGRLLITTGGLGFMRPASGTWGSLPPVFIAAGMIALGWNPCHCSVAAVGYHAVLIAILLIFCGACVFFGDAAEARFGEKDPSEVVADETAGQCLPLLALPAAAMQSPWHIAATLALAFFAFRILDIIKLPPARGLQRVPGGWGILLDDLVAGVQAMIVVQLVTRLVM